MDNAARIGRLELGWRYLRSEQRQSAREAMQPLLASDPNDADAHVLLGYCSLQEKQLDSAEAHAESVLSTDPGDGRGHVLIGYLKEERKNTIDARASFKRAIECDPEDATYRGILGWFCGRQGKLQEGITIARQGHRLDPTDGVCLQALQTLYRLADEPDEAEHFGKLALAADPEDALQHLEHGLRQLGSGKGRGSKKRRGASESLLESLRLAPTDIDQRNLIADEKVRAHPFYKDKLILSFSPKKGLPVLLVPAVWYGLGLLLSPLMWMFWISVVIVGGWALYSGSFYLCRAWVRRQIDRGNV